jgi:hypothetical protein
MFQLTNTLAYLRKNVSYKKKKVCGIDKNSNLSSKTRRFFFRRTKNHSKEFGGLERVISFKFLAFASTINIYIYFLEP